MISFSIPYPDTPKKKSTWSKEYGLNAIYAGKHWSRRKKDSEFWHWLVLSELRRQGIEPILFKGPVKITFYWNDKLDLDNEGYKTKLIIDSLKGKLICDDDKRYVRELHSYWHDENYILVKLEEI